MESRDTDHRSEEQDEPCAGVPRQFSVSGLLLVTLSFAVLFGILAAIGLPPIVFGVLATYLAGICIAQMLVFRGKKPREASLIAGALLFVFGLGVAIIAMYATGHRPPDGSFLVLVVIGPTIGAGTGYAAGGAVASVFLLARRIRLLAAKGPLGFHRRATRRILDDRPERDS